MITRFRWQTLCLQSEIPWIVPHVIDFLLSQGRMKFVRPLYRSLKNARVGQNGSIARNTFQANSEKYKQLFTILSIDNDTCRYHPIARKMIAVDLKPPTVEAVAAPKENSGNAEKSDNSWLFSAGVAALAVGVMVAVAFLKK